MQSRDVSVVVRVSHFVCPGTDLFVEFWVSYAAVVCTCGSWESFVCDWTEIMANRGESLRVSDSLGLKMTVNLWEYLGIVCGIGLRLMVGRWGCVGVLC